MFKLLLNTTKLLQVIKTMSVSLKIRSKKCNYKFKSQKNVLKLLNIIKKLK